MGTNGVESPVLFSMLFVFGVQRESWERMDARLCKLLQENPIIAAVRDESGLEK